MRIFASVTRPFSIFGRGLGTRLPLLPDFPYCKQQKAGRGLGTKLFHASFVALMGLYICCGIPFCLGKVWQHWCSEDDKSPPNTDLYPGLPLLPGACLQDLQVRFYPDSPLHQLHKISLRFVSHYNLVCAQTMAGAHLLIDITHQHYL